MREIAKVSSAAMASLFWLTSSAYAVDLTTTTGNAPIVGAEIELWSLAPNATFVKIGSAKSDVAGKATIDEGEADGFIYATASLGKTRLIAALGKAPKGTYAISDFTTIATVFTHAQFINEGSISGPEVSLEIASGHVKNLANPTTGGWGDRLLDGINSTESETLSRMNTLGNLIALCGDAKRSDHCDSFLKAAGNAADTLGAIEFIAKAPWQNPHAIFDVHDKAYIAPKTPNFQERKAGVPYVPYLLWSPDDWSMQIRIAGGGVYATGRIAFDKTGRLWSGMNWMPSAQNGAIRGIGGGLAMLDTDGTPLSPPITGFSGMGIDGVGWGTAIINDQIWLSSFNSTIGVFDMEGNPIGPDEGITLGDKIGEGQGIAVDMEGDIWVADASKEQMIRFRDGDHTKGEIIKFDGKLSGPFSISADANNNIYVSNSTSPFLTRFPADDPSKAENILVGISVRGLDIDTLGNVWVTSLMALDFPPPEFPEGELPILREFELAYNNLVINQNRVPTGQITMITPDGNQTDFTGAAHEVNVPWGLNIDGEDNIWVGQFLGRSVMLMCGAGGNCPEGVEVGDVIHEYKSGIIQSLTDAAIDQAGNVWAANNWNVLNAVTQRNPTRENSTKGGGSGLTVIYGVAEPISWPRQGPVKPLMKR